MSETNLEFHMQIGLFLKAIWDSLPIDTGDLHGFVAV